MEGTRSHCWTRGFAKGGSEGRRQLQMGHFFLVGSGSCNNATTLLVFARKAVLLDRLRTKEKNWSQAENCGISMAAL